MWLLLSGSKSPSLPTGNIRHDNLTTAKPSTAAVSLPDFVVCGLGSVRRGYVGRLYFYKRGRSSELRLGRSDVWCIYWRRRLQIGFLSCALLLLGGCGTIPDLKGLADATGEMRSGVVAVGNEYATSIPDDLNKCGGESCKRKFEAAWVSRAVAVAAIADYSDALAQVAAAGRDGAERADQVLSSATKLLGALSIEPLSAPIIGAAKIGLAELAKYRALRSMSEAVESAHPHVSECPRRPNFDPPLE